MSLGILTEKDHGRIIADIDRISAQAGVQQEFIYTSAHKFCTEKEVTQFKNMVQGSKPGLVFEDKDNVEWRMMALAGFCIRNYIDARVITMHRAIARHTDHADGPTVLLIPNFFVASLGKGNLPAWQVQLLMDLLYDRHSKSLKTVVAVSNKKKLADEYGIQVCDYLDMHFGSF